MELSEGGKVQKRYLRGNDLVLADEGKDSETTFYVMDSHGNVVQLTDDSGKVTKTYEYDSFGNEVKPKKKDENPFRYCGEYYDKETEEVYLRARYYQPAVGRFLTRDSYTGESDDPESLHLYTYCENDGGNCVDPSGHWSKRNHKLITKKVLKNKKIKNRIKKGSDMYVGILIGCVLPDMSRRDGEGTLCNTKTVFDFNISTGKKWKKWHGRGDFMKSGTYDKVIKAVNTYLLSISQYGEQPKYNEVGVTIKKIKNVQGITYKNVGVLLGITMHSTQDYYAHSYKMTIKKYRKAYKDYYRLYKKIMQMPHRKIFIIVFNLH